jgi:hypothetical protein
MNAINLSARSESVPAGASGTVYTISRVLDSASTLSLASGTNSNLTLVNTHIRATTPIAAGVSQKAIVLEELGDQAQRYAVMITGVAVASGGTPPATAIARVLFAIGQSNSQRMQINAKADIEAGLNTGDPTGLPTLFLDAAGDGSFLMQANAEAATAGSTNYWLKTDGTPGPRLTSALASIASAIASNQQAIEFYFNQGEAEAYFVGVSQGNATAWINGWLSVFATLRTAAGGSLRIYWVPMNRRGDTGGNAAGYEKLRSIAVAQAAAHPDYITLLPEMYDQESDGGPHCTPAGYKALAPRMTRKILKTRGIAVSGGVDGPRITAAARNGATVTATIAHDGGTDITPSSGIQGASYFIDGVQQTLGTGTRVDATHVSWTLPANVAQGTQEQLIFGYGWLPDVTDYTKILRDNQAVPLPCRWSETVATVANAAAPATGPGASGYVADPTFDTPSSTTSMVGGVTVAGGKLQIRQASAAFWTARIKGQAEVASGTPTKQLLAGHRYRVTATSSAPADGTTYSGNWSFVADPLNANIASTSKIQADQFATAPGTLVAYLPSSTGTLAADCYVGFNQRGSSIAANIDLDNVIIEDVTP